MEVAEIGLEGIEGQDGPPAPVEQRLVAFPVLDGPVEHLAHEQGHGILVEVAADAGKGIEGGQGGGALRVQALDGFLNAHVHGRVPPSVGSFLLRTDRRS